MKWEYHYILLIKNNHCTNKLNNYINITVKYSVKPKTIPRHYIRTPYNITYGPQTHHIRKFYKGHIYLISLTVVVIWTYY